MHRPVVDESKLAKEVEKHAPVNTVVNNYVVLHWHALPGDYFARVSVNSQNMCSQFFRFDQYATCDQSTVHCTVLGSNYVHPETRNTTPTEVW